MRTLLLLFLSAIAPAQGARSYQLKNGDVIQAEILDVDKAQDQVRLKFFQGGGSGIVTRRLSDFSPHSQFNVLRTTIPEGDIEGHVQLAEFAVSNGLIAAGKRELLHARDLANDEGIAPDLEQKLMDQAVTILDGLLQAMLKEGKMNDAKLLLHEIMAGPRLTDAQKQHFTDLVAGKSKEIKEANAKARADQRAAELSAEQQRVLKPLQDAMQRGSQLQQQALKSLQNQSQALNAYGAAAREFQAVQQEVEKQTRTYSNDKDLVSELAALSRQAQGDLINCLLGEASIYTTRSSFNQALGMVGQVLAMDSQNQQALNMRARIEIAANSDDGYIGVGTRPVRASPRIRR